MGTGVLTILVGWSLICAVVKTDKEAHTKMCPEAHWAKAPNADILARWKQEDKLRPCFAAKCD